MNLIQANDINNNNRLALIGKGNLASDYYNENRRQYEAYGKNEQGNYFIVYAIPDFTGWADKHLRIKLEILSEDGFKEYEIEYDPYGDKYEHWYVNGRRCALDFYTLVYFKLEEKFEEPLREILKETFRKSYGFDNYGEKIFEE